MTIIYVDCSNITSYLFAANQLHPSQSKKGL